MDTFIPCTIYIYEECEYQNGRIISNKVLDNGNKEIMPTALLLARFSNNLVRFHTGFYKSDKLRALTEELIKDESAKWGFFNMPTGEIVVAPRYDYVDDFKFNRALVILDGKYGFIDETGEIIAPTIYEMADQFYGDRAVAKKDDKYGFIAPDGTVAVKLEWDQVRSFTDERCAVKQGEKWFYVNKQGQIIPD
ncbi:MAG TPA: WG repeat-containing protein [Desulfosporosinus sp.]|nr:WG repeat-containing protein [Desulfosporosinus sp.]